MLHETKPAPRTVEPAPTNGTAKRDPSPRPGPVAPVVLKGLRPPVDAPPRRRSREVPDLLRPSTEPRAPSPRESAKPPAPAAPATRGSHVEPKAAPAAHSSQIIDPRVKGDAARADQPKNGSKSDLAQSKGDVPQRNDLPKGDLAPTWRKFLDRLTSTFDPRPTTAPEPPPAAAPPATPPPSMVLQPFAADIQVNDNEVAPDEAMDESHDSIGDLTDKQRKVLQGLTLPDNGELAPQWKKFLDRPTLDETKISVVRGYLQREFPLCTVYDFFDFQRNAQVFQLQDNHGKVTQLITMTAEFFDSHRDLEIRAWIEKHRLAQAMRQAGQAGVLVSQAGLQIEKR